MTVNSRFFSSTCTCQIMTGQSALTCSYDEWSFRRTVNRACQLGYRTVACQVSEDKPAVHRALNTAQVDQRKAVTVPETTLDLRADYVLRDSTAFLDLLDAHSLSQAALARQSGCTKQFMNYLVHGQRRARGFTAWRIATVLGVRFDWLFQPDERTRQSA